MIISCTTNWEVLTWYVDRKRVDIAKFFEGVERVTVTWPDESITEEPIILLKETTQVYDHGHTYPVRNYVPYVVANVRGIATRIRVDKFARIALL